MREILFRGKRVDNGEWIVGHLLKYEDGRARITESHTDIFCYEKDNSIIQTVANEVDPATVGQYTGLTDKNGEKIFEGDIVEGGDFDAEEGYGVIRWEDGAFEVATETFLGTFHENYWGKDFEIIGNIHDNPELMEVRVKAVLISIQPKWCEKIASGKKTLEVRKTRPKLETPFKCYIYMTSGDASYPVMKNGAPYMCHNNGGKVVIGEFVCDCILHGCHMANADIAEVQSCVRREDIFQYSNGKEVYGWHISDLVIYDEPKELREFKPWKRECFYSDLGLAIPECRECHTCKVERPPQSWCYVEVCDD